MNVVGENNEACQQKSRLCVVVPPTLQTQLRALLSPRSCPARLTSVALQSVSMWQGLAGTVLRRQEGHMVEGPAITLAQSMAECSLVLAPQVFPATEEAANRLRKQAAELEAECPYEDLKTMAQMYKNALAKEMGTPGRCWL